MYSPNETCLLFLWFQDVTESRLLLIQFKIRTKAIFGWMNMGCELKAKQDWPHRWNTHFPITVVYYRATLNVCYASTRSPACNHSITGYSICTLLCVMSRLHSLIDALKRLWGIRAEVNLVASVIDKLKFHAAKCSLEIEANRRKFWGLINGWF